MNPGDLRHQVTLQGVTRTDDGGGGYTEVPVTIATGVWAAVEPLEGNERIRAMQTEASATHRVTLRYRSDVTAALRVVHEGRTLEVVSPPIDPEERHAELQLLCREVR